MSDLTGVTSQDRLDTTVFPTNDVYFLKVFLNPITISVTYITHLLVFGYQLFEKLYALAFENVNFSQGRKH